MMTHRLLAQGRDVPGSAASRLSNKAQFNPHVTPVVDAASSFLGDCASDLLMSCSAKGMHVCGTLHGITMKALKRQTLYLPCEA